MNPTNLRVAMIPAGTGIRGPKPTKLFTPLGVCWHWTANTGKGANAEAHRKYFHNATDGTHYVLDDKEIIQLAPEDEVLWHAGPASLLTSYIRQKYPRGPNSSLIGVEMCVHSGYDVKKTYDNAIALGVYLCKKYKWDPEKDFVRHFDCTGKDCPRFWTKFVSGGEAAWTTFKKEVKEKLVGGKRTVEVEDTKIYLDGILKGEGIIINGVSYLPVRAMSNTPPYVVDRYDATTKAVYLKKVK